MKFIRGVVVVVVSVLVVYRLRLVHTCDASLVTCCVYI